MIRTALLLALTIGVVTMSQATSIQESNKAVVRESFERWAHGTGSPFELLYRNTYTWYFFMRDGKVTKAIAFFDTREFDDFWQRVKPR